MAPSYDREALVQQDDAMIEQAALGWIIRLQESAFDDWEAFETWLAADPAHTDTYHRMALEDREMATLLSSAPPVPQPAWEQTKPRTRRYWLGGALAATLVAVVSFGIIRNQPEPYAVETKPGERRSVALADGSHVVMNGGTKVMLDRKDVRVATLERGEAVFTVRHDAAHQFTVHVGDATLVDIGTAFAVVREAGVTQVTVSEGAVMYNPDAEAVQLNAGHRLRAADDASRIETGSVAPEAVASWQAGRLIYAGEPLNVIAADLARYYGADVAVSPAIAGRPFHGVIKLEKTADFPALARLLDVRVARRNSGWILLPR